MAHGLVAILALPASKASTLIGTSTRTVLAAVARDLSAINPLVPSRALTNAGCLALSSIRASVGADGDGASGSRPAVLARNNGLCDIVGRLCVTGHQTMAVTHARHSLIVDRAVGPVVWSLALTQSWTHTRTAARAVVSTLGLLTCAPTPTNEARAATLTIAMTIHAVDRA